MTIALILGGLYSMNKVPLDAVPDITNNQVLVITTAPNLGTEDIEQFVTYQVELAVANLPDVIEIRSVSRFGLSVVTIVFKDEAGTYLPRQLVSEALAEVKSKIPEGFGEPFMAPISTGLGEIYQYTLEVSPKFEDKFDDMELRTIQEWIVKRQMAMLPGVVEVNSFGGRGKQYEVSINPDKLRSMNVTMSDVFDALKDNNQNTGGAYIEKNHQANFIRGEGLMRSIEDIKNTLVENRDGRAIFIRDVAEVKFGSFVRYGAFTENGKGEAVGGIVMMLKDENSNDVIDAVKERVALIQKSLPEGVTIKPFLDRSKLIKNTTSTVAENLALGALIVIFILVIFLGNLRGGLIVASTIPLALLFAFIMMNIFGVWANLMSLGALDFGILIDGAVIIIESMIFYLHSKSLIGTKLTAEERDKIAFKSASKMMNSAFFGQLIILIVFIPILALQGIEGKMFIPMAQTFGFAIIGVAILSLTYIPMMAATFLNAPKTDKKSFGDKTIIKIENFYSLIIQWAINNGKIVISSALALLITGVMLFNSLGAEFIPKLDEGDLAFQIFMKPGTSLSETKDATTKIQKILLDNFPNEIESIQSRIGVADLPMDPMPLDIADCFVILKPQDRWTNANSKKDLADKMKEELKIISGINFEFTQPLEMRFNELLTGVREDVAVKLYGDNLDILASKAIEISKLISGIDGVGGVKAEATKGLPQITVTYNRTQLGLYGLKINALNTVIQTAFSGAVAGSIYEGERMFDLVVRLDEKHRKSIDDIKNLYITTPDGVSIPLSEVADVSYKSGPMQIGRDNTNRRTYVGVNVEGRDIKSLVEEIQETLDEKLELPTGYYIRYGGAFENLERASKRLAIVVPIALALIFMLVFFAVKSMKYTLMIYMAVPFAAVGGIFSLYLRDMPFSISAGVGFIVLFGVAVLNGLVLISGFSELKAEGIHSIKDIIVKGSMRRIRPILLTASTDILGFLPMAISTSAGAEVQQPLATVVIGGMLTSTLLTLIVLPILYNWIENMKFKSSSINSKTAIATILVVGVTGFTSSASAQEIDSTPVQSTNELEVLITKLSLNKALSISKENYPSLKSAQLEVDKQKALKSTAFDFGSTSIYTGKDEVLERNAGTQNIIGVSQNGIDLFSMPAKSGLANSRTDRALNAQNLTVQVLTRDVSIAWYRAAISKKQWELFSQLDSLYENFEEVAKIRYKTQQTSKLEYISASAKYKQLKVNTKKSESNYYAALQILNQYLVLPEQFDVDLEAINNNLYIVDNSDDTLQYSPELKLMETTKQVAESQWKAQRSGYLPKIDLGYSKQAVDGTSGYYGWQVGVSVPLVFNTQHGKTKAAKLDMLISENQYEQRKLELNAQYNQMMSRYLILKDIINYYETEALPLVDEQMEASTLSYKLGSIGYVQYIQNMEAAINTLLDFYIQQAEYYELSAQIKYLTGK